MDLQKRTWAEIHLDAIAHNYRAIRASLPAGVKFLGVVKADAYGHGAVRVSQLLEGLGADYLAVSCLDEALELREAGIHMPILLLGHTPPAYVPLLMENDLTQTVTCEAKAIEYEEAAQRAGGTLRVHIKLDTGMSRLGFLLADFDAGVENVIRAVRMPHLDVEGVFTHFAMSDEPGEEARDYTLRQFDLFTRTLAAVEEKSGFRFRLRHCANSGAVVSYPETCLDMVRPGLLLYGYGDGGKLGLKPCMDLITTVSTIKHYEAGTRVSYGGHYTTPRHTRMGVLPIGYADGLFRCLSDKCRFYVNGSLVPQRGRICMDMCMVDLTDRADVSLDSRVEIFGSHADLEALAAAAGTIPYELLCSVSKRVPRVYFGA
ncbi:MAG: alanine racemase [bacterium]